LSRLERRGLELVIEQVARENPKAKEQTPESLGLLKLSILDKIKKSGFIEKFKRRVIRLARLISKLKNTIGQQNRMPVSVNL